MGLRLAAAALLLTALLALGATDRAEDAPAAGPAAPEASAPAADRGPVAVPEPSERALRYYRSGNALFVVGRLWDLLVPALLLASGLSARLRDLAIRAGRRFFFVVAIYAVLLAAVLYLLDLPLAYYAGFVRPHAYALSNQTLGKWLGDSLKSLGLTMGAGVLFLWIPYLLLRRSPRRWWLATGALVPALLFLVSFVQPIWIAPLFNDFGPVKDRALEARILDLAERAGIEDGRVYEVNKSVDTKTVNAYVNGFRGTKRIVFWDTLTAKLAPDEVLFVMGHEMGHYAMNHVVKGIAVASLLALATLYAIHRSAGALLRRAAGRFGFDRLSDVASLPLLLLLGNLFALAATPLGFAFSRHMEHEADRFALEITRDNHAGASAFAKLQAENLGNPWPGPLYRVFRATHPVLGERIGFANAYRPWESGEPLRYQHLFQSPPGPR
jgi:Zn-dependent protease with chaperone function